MRRYLALTSLAFVACTARYETTSQPTTLHLRFADRCDGVVLEQYRRGDVVPIAITGETADVDVPAMGGGYSERAGKVSNVHDPYKYKNLIVRKDDRVLAELSVDDVRALPKAPDGRAIVRVACD
jgi:hypothetical protein